MERFLGIALHVYSPLPIHLEGGQRGQAGRNHRFQAVLIQITEKEPIYNAKDKIPPPAAQTLAVFDQGHAVGSLAKKLFPEGIEIGQGIADLDDAVWLTKEALKLRKPLFEAAFAAGGGHCRVDILKPVLDDAWEIIEVKSTTSAKDTQLQDLAFQAWLVAKAGVKIRAIVLLHINPEYVRHGLVDPHGLFKCVNVTRKVQHLHLAVADQLAEMSKVIRQRECPDIKIGPHCDHPHTCPLHDRCWAFLPAQSVMDLYRGKKKGFALLANDIADLRQIPGDYALTTKQAIQKVAAESGQPWVFRAGLVEFLKRLQYPLHFLDFETFATAIPLFDGIRPYQQVAFQFSLHVVQAPGAKPQHWSFLADGTADPRSDLMQCLRDRIALEGSVVAFNAQFEIGRLRECCASMPEHQVWLAQILLRIVDLLEPFREFLYYHPRQRGSASMKAVLPALTGRSYGHLAIQEGTMASLEFLRVHFTDVPEAERQRVRRELEEYCGQDTEGMIWIVEALRRQIGSL